MNNDYDSETKLLTEYDRTKCTCEQDRYKICHVHRLIYCIVCDGFLCPKCEAGMIENE